MKIKNSLAIIKLYQRIIITTDNIFCRMSSLQRWDQQMNKLSYSNIKDQKLLRVKYAHGVTMKINNLNIFPLTNKRKQRPEDVSMSTNHLFNSTNLNNNHINTPLYRMMIHLKLNHIIINLTRELDRLIRILKI
jgi:hypothetical protein